MYCTGMGLTCVSLKSLTPTQYTIAPRDRALSACWKKKWENTSVTPRKLALQATLGVCLRLLELKLQQFRKTEPQFKVATSCCAVVSWCSCSSPSVSAMITLAVPGRNIQAVTFIMIGNLEVGFHTNGLFKSYQSSPGVSARLPSNQKTIS